MRSAPRQLAGGAAPQHKDPHDFAAAVKQLYLSAVQAELPAGENPEGDAEVLLALADIGLEEYSSAGAEELVRRA